MFRDFLRTKVEVIITSKQKSFEEVLETYLLTNHTEFLIYRSRPSIQSLIKVTTIQFSTQYPKKVWSWLILPTYNYYKVYIVPGDFNVCRMNFCKQINIIIKVSLTSTSPHSNKREENTLRGIFG